jgi:hypothetical protein
LPYANNIGGERRRERERERERERKGDYVSPKPFAYFSSG